MAKSPPPDFYAALGIDDDADIATVRRAYRQLALRWHPDRAGPDTTTIFQKIAAAYDVLSDPVRRATYDRESGITGRRMAAAAAARATAKPAEIRRRAPGVMLSRLSRSLDILLAMGAARRADDDVIELLLDTWEAEQGGMVTISMRVPVQCPRCQGTGTCADCESRGTVDDLFAAWLAVPPGVEEGTVLTPSARLPGMIRPVSFRVRVGP